MPKPSLVALIPARAGSTRLVGKNIRPLGQHPLIAYTIASALRSEVFSAVIVSTNSERYAETARYYGAEVPFLRPNEFAGEESSDIEWVEDLLTRLQVAGRRFDCFSILRPTSPFRQPETIRRAWEQFLAEPDIDSLRAVERCKQHPGKMWVIQGRRMVSFVKGDSQEQPWHSRPYQVLPEVYVQNASLEIAWMRVVFEQRTITGRILAPFLTQGHEGLDINEPQDWWYAEHLVQTAEAQLPHVPQLPMPGAREECIER